MKTMKTPTRTPESALKAMNFQASEPIRSRATKSEFEAGIGKSRWARPIEPRKVSTKAPLEMIGGVPHKRVDGKLVPLKSKQEVAAQ